MRVDAHQHFWQISRGDYGWLTPDLGVLYRDYLPGDLAPHLQERQIQQTILVQAAPTREETDFLLRLYEETPFIAGVVGWLDMESLSFPEEFARYREHPGFVGLRPMLQDLEDDRWILRPQVMKHVELLVQADFPLDLLVFPRHLPYIKELLQSFPSLRGVIDHAAKPPIAKGLLEPWKELLADIAAHERILCKLSGLVTEADHQHWTVADLAPYVQHVIEVFGADRTLYGSDWPVCLLAGSYGEVFEALQQALPAALTEAEREAIFGGNAIRFYKLKGK
ncbi:amidohydrolase family protein [Brevibacillus migulae]|uniref:amidohydrolase family protein n=1 Tax=Brevibacillus migulae TaxID=1644114 RepID=UPI001F470F07|nr:amidohydrolase family protein [Brevibacillus migulae]